MRAVRDTSGIFYVAAYEPDSWLVLDGEVYYWPAHLMSDQAARFQDKGFLAVRMRDDRREMLLKTDAGYLDQVIICSLIMCSNLCGKPISSSLSSRPYKRDSIYLSLLHDNIKTIAGQVAAHFKEVEKVLS